MTLKHFGTGLLLTAIAVTTLAACAGDKGTVNYVQPGFVRKSDLLGKSWYYRRTVIDTPEGNQDIGYATIGSGDIYKLERVKFDIEENFLIAYRDYEYFPGTEGTAPQDSKYMGGPVVAFPITDHFDIAHTYNAATGERTNVIQENTTDREWFDRDFMRVDWSHTLLSSQDYYVIAVDYLDEDGHDGGELYYHEDDATNPWRARITPDAGYFDFVVLHRIQPDYYACYYTYDALGCGTGEVRVRHAFMQIDESLNTNYEPLYYPDAVPVVDDSGNEILDPSTGEVVLEPVFQRFGYYRLDRLTYTDQLGLTESGRLYRMLRFDIWEQSVDASGNPIPYAQRTVKPLNYYLNYDFPSDLVDTAMEVASEWNDAFKTTVADLQGIPVDQVPDVFILHVNDCTQDNITAYLNAHADINKKVHESFGQDLSATTLANYCATAEYHSHATDHPFTWEQVGDPRFNMLVWVTEVVQTGWSGYGPMMADPTNGRIIVSNAFISGWTIEAAATRALQYIEYMNGELTLNQVLAGSDVPSLINESTTNYDPQQQTLSINSAQASALAHRASAAHMASLESRMQVAESGKPLITEMENPTMYDDRLELVQSTTIEKDYLVRPEDLMVASDGSWGRGQQATDDLYHSASVVTRVTYGEQRQQYKDQLFDEHMFCDFDEVLDEGLVGLAKELKGQPRETQRSTIRARIFRAVALHELGHNVGLRHNFSGSYDALNYGQTFWNIETSGADEETKLEENQPEYKYSSIMDYHGKVNADFQGLGLYDKAAVKFGYGQLLEHFNSATAPGGDDLRNFREDNDYRKLPTHLGSVTAMHDRSDQIWDWRVQANITQSALATLHSTEVPYLFCADEFAQWLPECRRFDFGASAGEQVEALYVRWKNYFLFNNFLRDRLQVPNSVTRRGYAIFYDVLNTYQYMMLYRSRDPNFLSTDHGVDMASAVARGLNAMAEIIAMPEPAVYYRCELQDATTNAVISQMYYPISQIIYDPIADVDHGFGPNNNELNRNEICYMTAPTALGLGDAEPLFLGFTEDFVDWTFSYLGTYWDKESMIVLLTTPNVRYIKVNGAEDFRNYSVSMYRVYRPELLNLFEGLIRYDFTKISSNIVDNSGTAVLTPIVVADPTQPLSETGYFPPTTATPLPGQNIIPTVARNLQREAFLFALARLSSPLDEEVDFDNYARVWVRGAVDELFNDTQFAAFGADGIECSPEASQTTFRAVRAAAEADAGGQPHDIAFNLVADCAARLAEFNVADAALTDAKTNHATDAVLNANAQRNWDIADQNLTAAGQMLQYARLVGQIFEHGVGL